MSKPLNTYYDATKYLGQFVGQLVEDLKDTSCMGSEERELILIFKWIIENKDFFSIPKEDIETLTKVFIPLFEKLGYANWIRDTVTDMALRKANPKETEDWENFEPQQETNT